MSPRILLPFLVLLALADGGRAAEDPVGIEEKSRAMAGQWKERFEAEKLNHVIAGPWVIAGDGGVRRLEGYRDRTILAAQRALKASFFEKEPGEPVLILLFETEEPYRRAAKEWFGDEGVTPFGYFRRQDRVMLMNVGTGTGTLVHELVHALIVPDFPNVPDWFNEGLGSLYEQCTINGAEIRGLENWRLPALQEAIREERLRPVGEMISDADFYGNDASALNYAHARYFLFYLQEKGLLKDYYRRFRDGAAEDATGLKTLEKLIAPAELEAFDAEFRRWVLGLKFE